MKTLKEKIAVMQAFAEGKKIVVSSGEIKNSSASSPTWNWKECDYDVVKEPDIVYVVRYPSGQILMVCPDLVRANHQVDQYGVKCTITKYQEVME